MVNHLLVKIVNSVLGAGKATARGNQAYHCPFCHHSKPKLEVNFTDGQKNPWHCWVCNKKGTNLVTLLKQAKAPDDRLLKLKSMSLIKIIEAMLKRLKQYTYQKSLKHLQIYQRVI